MKVTMLGTSFVLQSDEDLEYLKKLAGYYEEKIEETRRKVETTDPIKLSILTGMLIADELFKARAGDPGIPIKDLEEAEKITLSLLDTITQTLEENELEPDTPADEA